MARAISKDISPPKGPVDVFQIHPEYEDAMDGANDPNGSNPFAVINDLDNIPTDDQDDALDGANDPNGSNPFATMSDLESFQDHIDNDTNPHGATSTPTANKIAMGDADGDLNQWITALPKSQQTSVSSTPVTIDASYNDYFLIRALVQLVEGDVVLNLDSGKTGLFAIMNSATDGSGYTTTINAPAGGNINGESSIIIAGEEEGVILQDIGFGMYRIVGRTHPDLTLIKLDDLASPDDNTDLDSSESAHGLLPKLSGDTNEFLRGDGAWAEVGGESSNNHNDLSSIQGGAEGDYFHLKNTEVTDLTDGNDCGIHKHDDRYYTETELTNRTITVQPDMIKSGNQIQGFYSSETQPRFSLDRDAGGFISGKAGLLLGPGGTTAPDVNLYRDSANMLKTDDNFTVGGELYISGEFKAYNSYLLYYGSESYPRASLDRESGHGTGSSYPGLLLGSGATAPDVNLFRESANLLRTNDSLSVDGYVNSNGGFKDGTRYQLFYSTETQPRIALDRDTGGTGKAGIEFGAGGSSAKDTVLYRDSANVFKTPDTMDIGDLKIAGNVLSDSSRNISSGNIQPTADNTYYIGKNDDDTPLAYKGLILKDTTNGKYYRIEVTNGNIVATDLSD